MKRFSFMATAQKTKPLIREDSYELGLSGLVVRNKIWKTLHLRKPYATEILERFPDGEFDNSNYNIRQSLVESMTIGEDDHLTVESVVYGEFGNIHPTEKLSFEEYVVFERKESILVEKTRRITPSE